MEVRTSDIRQFLSCRQRWDYNSLLRQARQPEYSHKAYFFFGNVWHELMEEYYSTYPDVHLLDMRATWNELARKELGRMMDEDPELHARDVYQDLLDSMDMGRDLAAQYELWAVEHDDYDEILHLEPKVMVPLEGLAPHIFAGRVDGVVRRRNGQLWLLEYKTTAGLPKDDIWMATDLQTTAYCWAMTRIMGERVYGMIYTFVFKKQPRPPMILKAGTPTVAKTKLTNTTGEMYRKTLQSMFLMADAGDKYNEILTWLDDRPNPFFRRIETRRTAREVELFEQRLNTIAKTMLNPDILIYPSPDRMKCASCPFVMPCVAKHDGTGDSAMLAISYVERPPRD